MTHLAEAFYIRRLLESLNQRIT